MLPQYDYYTVKITNYKILQNDIYVQNNQQMKDQLIVYIMSLYDILKKKLNVKVQNVYILNKDPL